MELDTVNAYSTVGMEQGLSGDPWDCLFGSDSISDAFQGRPEMLHMGIRRCDNTDQVGWLGFDFDDVLTETDEDPIGFNEKSHSSNSNLDELNLDSDSELALTLDPNLILPRNMPSRSPATNSDAAMLETASVEENTAAENEGDETENESEVERTENDEENESEEEDEDEEEEEVENEENEHNETEYETEEEETEDEEEEEEDEEEGEETEDDEQDTTVQQPLTPLSVEAPTSISSSSEASVGARTLTAAAALATSSPTIQLTRLHHPNKINTLSAATVKDIKMLAANPGSQSAALQQIRKQMPYNNNVHDVSTGAPTTVMIQAAKREKDLTTTTTGNQRDNSYPKPAYSYSCLIAMALKNSRTGSLPVSEIYNFMCRHFPYFTTAPTGWKNSVRHNLSLNKCFEKIEKPPGNGSQRKGCLWAIAPSKVAKMDEEVRKWSRKDPTAIKRAMVNPDQLELLERGEMKYEGEDRQEDGYEDAESYADSETGGSAVDEVINDDVDENVTYDAGKLIDVDDDLVVEQLYEDLDLVDSGDLLETQELNRGEQLMYQLVSCAKRQKTLSGSPISSDYVYQQVDAPSRKKAHFVALRPGGTAPSAGSLLEAE